MIYTVVQEAKRELRLRDLKKIKKERKQQAKYDLIRNAVLEELAKENEQESSESLEDDSLSEIISVKTNKNRSNARER